MKVVEFKEVSKKFKKGEKFDSLRDFIPNLIKNSFSRNKKNDILNEKEFWAVKNASFEIQKGECLGIIGANGSGKSTILKLLSKILKPTKGEIKINGKLSALIEVGAGFHQDLTGRENIYLNGTILGMKKKEIDKKFDSIVEFSELADFIDTPVKRYSSGMYVRLGFSVAIHLDPEILLIDEVLSVGDFKFQSKCMKKMHEYIKNGVTIIFISHNLPAVVDLCPKSIFLDRGEIKEIGDSKKAVHSYSKAWAEKHLIKEEVMRIKNIRLMNSKREICGKFNAGETAILVLEVESDIELENIGVAFTIKEEDGLMVFDSYSEMYSGKTYFFRSHERKEIEIIFNVAVPEGLYYIGTYLQHVPTLYFYNEEIYQFHVNSPKLSGRSYTFLDVKWQ